MKASVKKSFSLLVLVILASGSIGCSMKFGMFLPNTRYAYPNSNVEALGHVEGTSQRMGFLGAPPIDKEMLDEAVNNALKQKGGDMLINIKMQAETLMIPPIPVGWTTLKVSGTAAKMTIGKQELK